MTPSPYWRAYVDALPDNGTVTVTNGDLRRLVEQLEAIERERERARADAEQEAYLRRCAEIERDRVQRQLEARNT